MAQNNSCNYSPVQYDVLVGSSNNGISSVDPSSTSGIPLVSNGSSANPSFTTAVVAGGGTGAVTLTGLLTGNGTSAVTATAITQYNVITAGASNAPNNVAPSATSGIPFISQGSSSQPAFGTAVVAGGGTGVVTMTTAYAPVCAGTTATGALQVASTGLSTSGYVLTSTGASSLPSFQAIPGGSGFTSVALQVFTASGTYTPTSGMVYCIIEVWGGGGAGGGSVGGGTTYVGLAGGAGGYSRGVYSSGTIGASTSVTIGAAGTGSSGAGGGTGGTTSVGSTLIQATGGTGGSAQSNPSPSVIYAGGAGGVGSLGTINLTGSPGLSLGYGYIGGAGGPTIFGPGAFAANPYANGVNAAAATAPTSSYGAGGSGSANGNGSTGSKAGSNGVAGIVIITEFLS